MSDVPTHLGVNYNLPRPHQSIQQCLTLNPNVPKVSTKIPTPYAPNIPKRKGCTIPSLPIDLKQTTLLKRLQGVPYTPVWHLLHAPICPSFKMQIHQGVTSSCTYAKHLIQTYQRRVSISHPTTHSLETPNKHIVHPIPQVVSSKAVSSPTIIPLPTSRITKGNSHNDTVAR